MSEIRQRKRLVRRAALARRARLSAEERRSAGEAAAEALLATPEMQSVKSVMAFASFGTEIDTTPLVEALLRSGRRVLMPKVDADAIMSVAISSIGDLAPGFRGIPEPPSGAPEPLAGAEAIVVPGVAFDLAGGRLGYGGGFYDELLAAAPGVAAGFCLECQIVDEVPAEPHDRPVAFVVTEQRIIRPGRG